MADDNSADDVREGTTANLGEGDTADSGEGNASDSDRTADDPKASLARVQRELAKAKREAAANRTRLAEFEDRDKTEQQRAAEKADAAEQRAKQAESRLLRLEVAARKGLPAALAARLQGDSEEDLEADADALLELVGDKRNGAQPATRRRDPDQGRGNGQNSGQDESDMNDWLRRAAGVRAE